MTRPVTLPVDHLRRHVRSHHSGYQGAMVLLFTFLFLLLGAVVAITQILPDFR